jgi:hypothetical protein
VLLPGLNLFVAGSVLAELEHTALGDSGAGPGRPGWCWAGGRCG